MSIKSAVTTKTKQKNGVIVVEGALGGQGVSWSTLEDINDPESVWIKAVNRVAAAACKGKTVDDIFKQASDELRKMGVSSVFLMRETTEINLCISNVTVSSGEVINCPASVRPDRKPMSVPPESGVINRVLACGDVVLTTDPDERLRQLLPIPIADTIAATGPLSFVCAPLSNTGRIFGVLVAASPDMTYRKVHSVALLAHIASMSLYNNRLIRKTPDMREKTGGLDVLPDSMVSAMDKSLKDVVHALTVPMEKRDPYTFGHQTRVTRLAVAIAEEMGLGQYHVDGLRLAASIHDIGKIVIPFEILNRPTLLSEAEFNLIKMHPQVAFDMLSPISFRWPVGEMVLQHHERADGSGYPRGLKSGQTLLEAKILAVADVVEAMSSHRPYRASLGIDAALDEVATNSSTLYDSEAVAACIRLLLIKNFNMEGGDLHSASQS